MGQFINSMLLYDKDNKKERLLMVTKDDEGHKKYKFIDEPSVEFYITKEEFRGHPPLNYIDRDKVDPVISSNRNIIKTVVKKLEDKELHDEFSRIVRSGNRFEYSKLRDFHLNPNVHGSDVNVEDHYIANYINRYQDEGKSPSLNKMYFDIEVDTVGYVEGFPDPEEALAPINAISAVDASTNKVYVYTLKYDNEQYKKTMADKQSLINELDEKYKEKGLKFTYEFNEYDEEIDLIYGFLDMVNNDVKPDFNVAFNMGFDFGTIHNRIINLGEDPAEFFSPKDFEYKKVVFRPDNNSNDISDKSDVFQTTSYTNWVDLLSLYANINKPKGRLESYSLDFIGNLELGEEKDEFEGSIVDLHFRDYRKFLLYNIQDTILTMMIDDKVKFIDLLYMISIMTRTRISKALKKTICLRNFAEKFYREKGYVISNNRSRLQERHEGKIKGGFVGDPNNVAHIGMKLIEGLQEMSDKIFNNVSDFDLASLYPSIMEAFNISPETFVCKLNYAEEKDGEFVNKTPEFIDDYNSNDGVNFCVKYMGMPDLDTASEEIIALLDSEVTVNV